MYLCNNFTAPNLALPTLPPTHTHPAPCEKNPTNTEVALLTVK